jgi:hypothetical protein
LLLNAAEDGFKHRFGFVQDLKIVEAKHDEPHALKMSVTQRVALSVRGFEVLAAIDFDHEPRGVAVEIDDVRSERLLAVEGHAQLFAPQTLPEFLLGVGLVAAQLAGGLLETRLVRKRHWLFRRRRNPLALAFCASAAPFAEGGSVSLRGERKETRGLWRAFSASLAYNKASMSFSIFSGVSTLP